MLEAKHHFFFYPFFQHYSSWKIGRNFHEVKVIGAFEDQQLPILLLANHVSWWDGFWIMNLDVKLLKRKFHFMMLEEQLRKHWYFRLSGGYSVRKNSKSVIESLQYTADLLQDSQHMVLMFPQGKITSLYQYSVDFEKGLERVLQKCKNPIQIVFLVNLTEYFVNPKPTLFMHIQSYEGENDFTAVQTAYNAFYHSVLMYHQQIYY
ncbi:lysophospholipid acyltransferase family protein [Seramator thermalis]|uniref:lysophospholipid acyltransferase family protein n=1 Tax=Seramator thermalis TaxID=2496270 RepID=UPI00101E05DE|nr:lysophospholipid acyltransferase family protein [Seramator thermalis]